jgi:predicted N-acyltransferase
VGGPRAYTSPMASATGAYEMATHGSIRDIGERAWSNLAGPGAPPFLSFTWLDALERHDRVTPERGWAPLHLTLSLGGELVAAAPAYVKGNSEGEFVFDHAWAHFAEDRLQIPYYPKLIVAVPFTPATGSRLLVRADADRAAVTRAFVTGLRSLCDQLGLSGAHVLFPPTAEAEQLVGAGMIHRVGVQFHWHNDGYRSFDDYLDGFNAKRRAQIRRERREFARSGTDLEVLTGSALTEQVADLCYEFYLSTVDKYLWGRRYLNRGFFREVCARMPEQVLVVVARDRASRVPLAGAFNLLGGRRLYGRYWGALHERRFLHFNVCYYAGVEECISRRLEGFEPGAGGEHKHARGFEPTPTHSAHLVSNSVLESVVRDYTDRERAAIAEHLTMTPAVLRRSRRAAE